MRTPMLCLALLVLSDASLAQSRPATARQRSARTPEKTTPGLSVSLYEVTGKPDRLKDIKPAEFESIAVRRELQQRLSSYGFVTHAIMFVANHDLTAPTRLIVGTRVPFTLSSPDRKRRGITYSDVGATLELPAARPEPDGNELTVPLKLTVASFPTEPGGRPERTTYEPTLKITPDQTRFVLLDDAPIQTSEGMSRLRMASLRFTRAARTQPAGAPRPEPSPPDLAARVDLNGLQLTSTPDQRGELDLTSLINTRPSITELLEKLKPHGQPFESAAMSVTCDLWSKATITQGERVPTVQDVSITRSGIVTPSVTYEEVGAILKLGPAQWIRSGEEWLCTTDLELDTSGIGQSAVTVAEGIKLPTFTQSRHRQRITFRSGVPEYFVSTGPPSPAGPDGNTTTSIVRLVLTRPGN